VDRQLQREKMLSDGTQVYDEYFGELSDSPLASAVKTALAGGSRLNVEVIAY
jgi:hypothetical protein